MQRAPGAKRWEEEARDTAYLYLWKLQPCGRSSGLCRRHSHSSGKWRNSPLPQMKCPTQHEKINLCIKKKLWHIRSKLFLHFYPSHSASLLLWNISQILSCQVLHQSYLESSSTVWHKDKRKWREPLDTHEWVGNRRSKAHIHIHTYEQTHTQTAAKSLMSPFAKKSKQLVLDSK